MCTFLYFLISSSVFICQCYLFTTTECGTLKFLCIPVDHDTFSII
uniref:Uncharacterized protein n=1 Tax=Arundo donax TaxID=35708 RepID=A0A0A9EFR2_ARUDO